MNLVTMKRGGAGGQVAINIDLITQVRSSAGALTDIHFIGQDFVTVEGHFPQVVARLAAAGRQDAGAVTRITPMSAVAGRRA
jgi:ApbE superfamily uncharacterized protein (UPF0280 family)